MGRARWRKGLDPDFINAGEQITVEFWKALDGTNQGHARVMTFSDGRRIELPEDRWMKGPAEPTR